MRELLIIGSGVVGLCTAYYCARRGAKVTVLERESAEHLGSSYRNSGLIMPSQVASPAAPRLKWKLRSKAAFSFKPLLNRDLIGKSRVATGDQANRTAPLLRDLHLASVACFEELATLTDNDFGLVKHGLLMLCKTEQALAAEIENAHRTRDLGMPAEILDPGQTTLLDPNVHMNIAGSVFFPKDCHLTPGRFMNALKQQLQNLNVQILCDTEMTGWRVAGDQIEAAQTSRGDFRADEYVLCGGCWSSNLARALRLNLPLQAIKGYTLSLARPRQLPSVGAIFVEAQVAATPMGTTLRFGGAMERADLDRRINWRGVYEMIDSIRGYYPDFPATDFDGLKPWCGLRPCSPDGLPYIGRTAAYRNLSVATGHSTLGLSLGPITGKLMAEILSDEKPLIDLELLNPDRYA